MKQKQFVYHLISVYSGHFIKKHIDCLTTKQLVKCKRRVKPSKSLDIKRVYNKFKTINVMKYIRVTLLHSK